MGYGFKGIQKEITGGITQEDIERLRKKIKVGDRIRVQTLKGADMERMNGRYYGVERRAVVVGKYPHFVMVELPDGTKESVLWVDLVKKTR